MNERVKKLIEAHGTLDEFREAVIVAANNLDITYIEAATAILKYEKELLEAEKEETEIG